MTSSLRIRRHFVIFLILAIFAVAQVAWWVYYQVGEGVRIREAQARIWDEQIRTTNQYLNIHLNDPVVQKVGWLENAFPDLQLSANGDIAFVSPEARARLEKLAGSRVRMFVSEGMFFSLLLLCGMGYIYWVMLREIQLERRQAVFVAATSHELKTPITSLRLYLDTLLERSLPPEKQQEILSTMRKDLERLTQQIDHLLHAQALMSNPRRMVLSDINITEETCMVLDEVFARFDLKGFQVQSDIAPDLHLQGDPYRWQTMVRNLLENAFKYSPQGGTLTISLSRGHRQILLTVKDQGMGFSAEERERIFDKFYRVGSEDTRRTNGTGLGLFLVREIAESFHGKVSAFSPGEGQGATFTVQIPTREKSANA